MHADVPSRRLVLRQALGIGCVLCLPIVLSGCDSKPGGSSPPAGAATPTPATGVAPATAATSTPAKMTQANARYQMQPKGEQKCGNCANFIAGSNTCKLVDGQISPEAWCTIWAKLA